MALAAISGYTVAVELAAMYIFMAARTFLRCSIENNARDSSLPRRSTMAVQTADALMGARQQEGRLRMIESRRLMPRPFGVAGGTA
jgi:hypothetical protein